MDVLPTLKCLPSELIVIGEKLIDQRPLFPLGSHFSLIPAICITVVVIVPSVDVMIHATRQAQLKPGRGLHLDRRIQIHILPVAMVVVGADNPVALLKFVIHDCIRLVGIGPFQIGLEPFLPELIFQISLITGIGFQVRISPADLERIDGLLYIAQLTQGRLLVIHPNSPTKRSRSRKGIKEGQPRIDLIPFITIRLARLIEIKTGQSETNRIIQLLPLALPFAKGITLSLHQVSRISVAIAIGIVRIGLQVPQTTTEALATLELFLVNGLSNEGIFFAKYPIVEVGQELAVLLLLVGSFRLGPVITAHQIKDHRLLMGQFPLIIEIQSGIVFLLGIGIE